MYENGELMKMVEETGIVGRVAMHSLESKGRWVVLRCGRRLNIVGTSDDITCTGVEGSRCVYTECYSVITFTLAMGTHDFYEMSVVQGGMEGVGGHTVWVLMTVGGITRALDVKDPIGVQLRRLGRWMVNRVFWILMGSAEEERSVGFSEAVGRGYTGTESWECGWWKQGKRRLRGGIYHSAHRDIYWNIMKGAGHQGAFGSRGESVDGSRGDHSPGTRRTLGVRRVVCDRLFRDWHWETSSHMTVETVVEPDTLVVGLSYEGCLRSMRRARWAYRCLEIENWETLVEIGMRYEWKYGLTDLKEDKKSRVMMDID
ncbi:hypothetical protein Tco_1041702 [Tanacetum coccineum]|uniref:Uncharacterized protein n=1 Tax=Tanacetum coccineum TaxID=301880 RepID=A0ABQ5GJA8_9ASTR